MDFDKVFGVRAPLIDYFGGQAEQLLKDSRSAAKLTKHPSLYGSAAEETVRKFFRTHLPEKYGVGSGHIVSYGNSSDQMDVVIYDRNECFKIPISSENSIYSVEGVYAAIEVKSSPSGNRSSQFIEEALQNIASIHKTYTPPFSSFNDLPLTDLTSFALLMQKGKAMMISQPIGCILVLGSRTKFSTLVKNLRSKQQGKPYSPRLFCVIDEKDYGLCGYDYKLDNGEFRRIFWQETCDSPAEALATFLYWLIHYMTFDRIIEKPIISKPDLQAVWPSTLARIVPRIKVDVSEDGHQRSWPWPRETRKFDPE